MINMVDEFVLYDDAQYTKRDWRNRNLIKTPNGLLWLSIPVETKGKYYQNINETRISDPSWTEQHWKSIRYNYKKSPYFREYEKTFEGLYKNCNFDYLSLVNYHFLTEISKILGVDTTFVLSSDLNATGKKTDQLVSICNELNATSYLSGPAAKAYIDRSLFEENEIELKFMDYNGYPEYEQAFGDFDHHVSIIDLIFCCGPSAPNYMLSF